MGSIQSQLELKHEFAETFKVPNKKELINKLNSLFNKNIEPVDIFQGITSFDIHQIIQCNNRYFEDFLQYLIDWLCDVAEHPHFLNAGETNLTNNILRVLTRIIPILYIPDNQEEAKKYLWDYFNPNYSVQELELNKNQKVVIYKCNDEQINKKRESHVPYGLKLIKSLIQLCFYEEYTIPKMQLEQAASNKDKDKDSKQIFTKRLWRNLRGLNNQLKNMVLYSNETNKYNSNRLLVLQCMLACFSQTLYQPNLGKGYLNPWVLYTVSPQNHLCEDLLLSLLFYFLSYREKSIIPYKERYKKISEDSSLSLISLQIFLILVDMNFDFNTLKSQFSYSIELHQLVNGFQEGSCNEIETPAATQGNNEKAEQELRSNFSNQFREFICSSFDLDIWQPLVTNIIEICYTPVSMELQLLPSFQKFIPYQEEMLLLLYQLCEKNEKFVQTICTNWFEKIITLLLFQVANSFSAQKEQIGTFLICVQTLTSLSKNISFNSSLGKKVEESIQFYNMPIIHGSYGDMIIIVLGRIILNCYDNYLECYPTNLLAILHNISQFITNISDLASKTLLQLLGLFNSYVYLIQTPNNTKNLIDLVQILDNIVAYHYEMNINLVVDLMKSVPQLGRIQKLSFTKNNINFFFSEIYQRFLITKGLIKKPQVLEDDQLVVLKIETKKKDHQKIEEDQQKEKLTKQMYEQQFRSQLETAWDQFNWGQEKKKLNLSNIYNLLSKIKQELSGERLVTEAQQSPQQQEQLQEQQKQKQQQMKVLEQSDEFELAVEKILKNSEVGQFVVRPKEFQFIKLDQKNNEIEDMNATYLWTQVYLKNQFFPCFDSQEIKYFSQENNQSIPQLQDQQQQQLSTIGYQTVTKNNSSINNNNANNNNKFIQNEDEPFK